MIYTRKPPVGSILNSGHSLSHGLIVRLLFNQGAGQLIQDVARNNHAIPYLANGVWVVAENGSNMDFNGATQSLEGPSLASHFTNSEGTYIQYCRLHSHTPGDRGAWGLNASNANSHYPFGDGNIYLGTFVTARQSVGAGIITDRSRWHQVAVTVKAGVWTCYQNAKVAFSASGLTFDTIDATRYLIGRSTTGAGYIIDGVISDVWIYNRALSQSELQWVMIEPYVNILSPRQSRSNIPSVGGTNWPAYRGFYASRGFTEGRF